MTNETGATQQQATMINAARISKLPAFFAQDPEFWFDQIEAIFSLNNITSDDTKFGYVMAHATEQIQPYLASACRDPVPEGSTKYKMFKERVISGFSVSEDTKLRKLFTGQCLGDRTPSQFLAILRNIAPGKCSDTVLKTLFLEQLPDAVRTVLAVVSDSTKLDALATLADKVIESTQSTRIGAIKSAPPPEASKEEPEGPLRQEIKALRALIDTLVTDMSHLRNQAHRSRSKSKHRTPTPSPDTSKLCFYHAKFGAKAVKCKSPCTWKPEN